MGSLRSYMQNKVRKKERKKRSPRFAFKLSKGGERVVDGASFVVVLVAPALCRLLAWALGFRGGSNGGWNCP